MEEMLSQKDDVSEILEELLERGDTAYLKTILIDLHPADIAEAITRIGHDKRVIIFTLLNTTQAAEVLIELNSTHRQEILQAIGEKRVVEIIGAMDSDDATDVVGELKEDVAQRVLNALPWKEFREVKTLLRHNEETAGGIMALEVVAVNQNKNAHEAQEVIRQKADEVEDVYNIYVVDDEGILKGFVSLKGLVLADPQAKLSEIMDKEAISVQVGMDREEVANLFQKYDLVAAPVLDAQGRLVGQITVDDVLDVLKQEVNEDITMMAGITDEEIRGRSIFKISGVRLPWLMVAFTGEMISAFVMSRFKASLSEIVASAFFIPLIMAMGGNTGIQSATVVIRGLATGEINLKDTGRRLLKEIGSAFLNGLIIALLLFGVSGFWLHNEKFGAILSMAMLAVILNAALMGTLIPFFLKRLGIDPAIATGPFITTSNDVLGLVVYFGMMTLFLQRL